MMGETLDKSQYHFFYNGPLSQWYLSDFIVDGITYDCAEQYMMRQKAITFGDESTAQLIMSSRHNPRRQKALGRLVDGFIKTAWESVARDVVRRGNIAKFSQDAAARRYLFETAPALIVEASVTDRIWGIGLSETDPARWDPRNWRGTNWLGEVLTQVREELMWS